MSEGAEKTMYIGLVSYLKENVSYGISGICLLCSLKLVENI